MYFLYKEINVKKNKLVTALLFCAVMFFVVSPLAAQSSNTAKSTADVFGNDIDNFMSTTDYGSVEFDKGFVFLGLDSNIDLNLGYATNISQFYLGAYYKGLMLQGTKTEVIDIETTPVVNNATVVDTSKKTTTGLADTLTTENSGAVLFGMGNMGFKLGVSQKAKKDIAYNGAPKLINESYTATSGTYTKTEYSDVYKVNDGSIPSNVSCIDPYFSFGMNLDLGDMILKPVASFTLGFKDKKDGYTKTVEKSVYGSKLGENQTKEKKETHAESYISIAPSLRASLVLPKDNGSVAVFSLDYSLDLPIYTTKYTDKTGSEASAKGVVTNNTYTVTTTETLSANTVITKWDSAIEEKSAVSNNIDLSAKYTFNPTDRLSLGYDGNLGFEIDNTTSSKTTYDYKKTVITSKKQDPAESSTETIDKVTPGNTVETAKFSISPSANVAMQYQIVPQKLAFNAGVSANLPQFENTKTTTTISEPEVTRTKKVDGNGKVETDTITHKITDLRTESQEVKTTWGTVSLNLNTGFTWNLTDKAAFDVSYQMSNGLNPAIFDLLTDQLNLQFTIKY